MARQLPGRFGIQRVADRHDLGEFGELLFGHRAAAQEFDTIVSQRHDGRFQSMRGWTGIDDQGDQAVEFFDHMRGGRGTNAAKSVGAWSSKRTAEDAGNFGKDRVRTEADRDSLKTGGDDIRDYRLSRKNKC